MRCVTIGYAETPDTDFPSQSVTHLGSGENLAQFYISAPPGQYWLIDMDYDSWAAVYSCGEVAGLVNVQTG